MARGPGQAGGQALLVFSLTRALTLNPPWKLSPRPFLPSLLFVLLPRPSTAVGTVPPPEWLPRVSHPLPWDASVSGLPNFGPVYTVFGKEFYSMDS